MIPKHVLRCKPALKTLVKIDNNAADTKRELKRHYDDSMQKAGDTLANTMSVSAYAAAFEGTRDAIAAAQRKKAKKSEAGIPTAESSGEKDFVTLQSSSIDVGIAMQDFLCNPSGETLKKFIKIMHLRNSQHSWYKTYKKKAYRGAAGRAMAVRDVESQNQDATGH